MDAKLSVVIPTLNSVTYLEDCLCSLECQTIKNFEVLFIDDGSTDGTREKILQRNDPRFRLIEGGGKGISSSLNLGLEIARSEFVARMDADDICLPDRFEKQLEAMHNDGNIGVCATNVRLLGVDWDFWGKDATDHKDFFTRLLYQNPICHPSVMFRKSLLLKHELYYDVNLRDTEDFDFFSRAVEKIKFKGLSQQLLIYRFHNAQSTFKAIDSGKKNYLNIIKNNFERRLNLTLTQEDLDLFWYDFIPKKLPVSKLSRIFLPVRNDSLYDYNFIDNFIKNKAKQYLLNVDKNFLLRSIDNIKFKFYERSSN